MVQRWSPDQISELGIVGNWISWPSWLNLFFSFPYWRQVYSHNNYCYETYWFNLKKQVHTLSRLFTWKLLDKNKYIQCSHSRQTNYWTKTSKLFVPHFVIQYSVWKDVYSLFPLVWKILVDENNYTLCSPSHNTN